MPITWRTRLRKALSGSLATLALATPIGVDRYAARNAGFVLVVSPHGGPGRAERAKQTLPISQGRSSPDTRISTASSGLIAQAQPDFSGSWRISQAKSSAGATGNNATISFPSELVIKQHPAELHVESRYPRSAPLTTVYKLDGSEITINLPSGVVEKARASWEGDTLVINARRVVSSAFGDFVTDSSETWRRAGDVLTVQKTQSADGVTDAETAVFDRDQP